MAKNEIIHLVTIARLQDEITAGNLNLDRAKRRINTWQSATFGVAALGILAVIAAYFLGAML